MSYTREAMPAAAPTPAQPNLAMKDEAVIDPYRRATERSTALGKLEQPAKGGASAGAESPTTAETVTLSPAAAALARKEQAFRQSERKLKEREAELEAKAAKVARLEAMEAKIAKKDYSDLESVVNYDDYTQHLLKKEIDADPTQARINAIEQKLEAEKTAREADVSKQFEAAVNERRVAATKLLETDPELAAFKAKAEKSMPGLKLPEAVTQHILDTWEHDSKELSVEEATKEVVDTLKERAKTYAALLEESQEPAVEDGKKTLPPMKPALKTITNQVTAGELKPSTKSFQHMNETERYAEARRRALEKMNAQRS